MRVVILGGGISGLLAAWVFREHKPIVLEAGRALGGSFNSGGLKYIRHTEAFRRLLVELEVEATVYRPRGGLLLAGGFTMGGEYIRGTQLVDHVPYMSALPEETRLELQRRHWERTRGTLAGFKATCMNDPTGEGDAEALHFNYTALVAGITEAVEKSGGEFRLGARVTDIIDPHREVWCDGPAGSHLAYDLLITTLPLGAMKNILAAADLPEGKVQTCTVGHISSGSLPRDLAEMGAAKYNYIYTPFNRVFHRLSRDPENPERWQAEATGRPDLKDFQEALGYGARVPMMLTNLPGHLLPLDREPQWPAGIVPLGRFAEWDTRSTAEKTLDRAIALKERL